MRFPGTTGRPLLTGALLAGLAVFVCGTDFPARLWAEEGPLQEAQVGREALERLLHSPLASDRTKAERLAVAQGERARPWARAWTQSTEERLRSAGWGVLAQVGAEEDLRAGLSALTDPQPAVRGCAAEAVVALATRLPHPEEPWIPAGALSDALKGPLALALARRIEATVGRTLPACIYTLGEGLAPALQSLCVHPRISPGVCDGALDALGVIGGRGAREALAACAGLPRVTERAAWWRALLEVGSGPGLAPVHEKVEEMARRAIERAAYRPSRPVPTPAGLVRLTRPLFYRFLASCPPPDAEGHVADFLLGRLAASAGRRERVSPGLVVQIVRAYLVLCPPDGDALRLAVRSVGRSWGRRSRGREEIGYVLVALEVYRDEADLKDALEEVLTLGVDLPRSVAAWGRYLLRGQAPETLQALALELLALEGASGTLPQRRLGALLADRVGGVDPRVRRTLLSDPDPWLRAWALPRAARTPAGGPVAPGVVQAALARGLKDESDTVFLVAAELDDQDSDRETRARVLRLAVGGPRSLRTRAWRILHAWLRAHPDEPDRNAEADRDEMALWVPPGGGAGLDERIRAAAAYRRHTGE